uniref:Deleted in azoospermia-like n=1 Tax=Sparus aurata TaxID=8175 RepID=A0A671Y1F6_SPAAU
MDIHKPRSCNQFSPALKLANGYILPEGKLTPNALFVGGIDMKVDENEMQDFFARYGAVKEVKIITYRGGICKGYGFVYFNEDVNIQSIIEQQISFKGRKLKLGPAIMKERSSRMYCDFWLAAECNMLLINVLFNTVVYIFLSSRVHAIPSSWPSSLDEPHSVLLLRLLLTHGRGYGTTITHLQWGQPLQSAVLLLQHGRGHDPTDANELPTEPLCLPELCGLWSPDYADCAVVHSLLSPAQDTVATVSQNADRMTS